MRTAVSADAAPNELFNRELSWLEFNRRVLAEAEDEGVPLLERVKFLSIAAGNLDEFLMVRAGAIHALVESGIRERSVDGLTPKQQLKAIRTRVKSFLREMHAVYEELATALRAAGVRIGTAKGVTKKQEAALAEEFEARIAPVLTPLAVDPTHPFPFLASGALNLAIVLGSDGDTHIAFIRVPSALPRFIALPGSAASYVPIEDVIRMHVSRFFPGLKVEEVVPFRVIRNADFLLREDEVEDLLKSVETELRRRERKEVVWMEIGRDASDFLVALLQHELEVEREDTWLSARLPKLGDLMQIYARVDKPSLRDEPFNPRMPAELATSDDMFSIIRSTDVLLHRPYDSFTAVVELIQSAADDPNVVAIKQTLYRAELESVVVDALARAAERGKQVTAVVELQARFDEARNIVWARRLEEAGVQVVYGLVGIKTHCKICLVVRNEGNELRRYVHLSTGNYNATTARVYTDLDLLTAHPDFGDDAAQLMNLLTGYSAETAQEVFQHHAPEWKWKRFVAAPMHYHAWVLSMIEREEKHARAGRPAQIIAKMNALVETEVIRALYRAAAAGVKIDLIVRGICCLVPRDNIRVVSIIDRFLEHSRTFVFRNGGATEVWVASGDWMPRNFFRRVEVAWPILGSALCDRIEHQILATCLADDQKAWRLQPDGTYRRRKSSARGMRSQQRFIEIARAESVRMTRYEEARKKGKRKKGT
jgi:polyphosphate kinase